MATYLDAAYRYQHRSVKSMATSEELKHWGEGHFQDTMNRLGELGEEMDAGLIKKIDILFQRVCLSSSRRWSHNRELISLNRRRTSFQLTRHTKLENRMPVSRDCHG
jgi:hypothetical protein